MASVGVPRTWTAYNRRVQFSINQPLLLGISESDLQVLSWGISLFSNAPGSAHIVLSAGNSFQDLFGRKPTGATRMDTDEPPTVPTPGSGVNASNDVYGAFGQQGIVESYFVQMYGGSVVRDYLPGKGPAFGSDPGIFLINNPGAVFSYTAWMTVTSLKT